MAKYLSEDSRTGYPEGEVVELTDEDLAKLPLNVKFKKLEPIDEKSKIEDSAKELAKKELEKTLRGEGLSNARTVAVLSVVGSEGELLETLKVKPNVFEPLTLEFLNNKYNSTKPIKKKKAGYGGRE